MATFELNTPQFFIRNYMIIRMSAQSMQEGIEGYDSDYDYYSIEVLLTTSFKNTGFDLIDNIFRTHIKPAITLPNEYIKTVKGVSPKDSFVYCLDGEDISKSYYDDIRSNAILSYTQELIETVNRCLKEMGSTFHYNYIANHKFVETTGAVEALDYCAMESLFIRNDLCGD